MRTDLPQNRGLRRDIQLLERYYRGKDRVDWDIDGQWLRVNRWVLPAGRFQFNCGTIDVLIMVPSRYGEASGDGTGLEEFYIPQALRIWRNGRFEELPHSYTGVDRRGGEALRQGWRYLCVHTKWDPKRDTVMTAMIQLGLVFSDPWEFARLANRNGRAA